jgi:peroxiredoxin Q/BCP
MVQPGDIAPTFEAYDQHGELHELEDYEGEWIVLYFYPKDDTPGCTTEACNFRDNLTEIQKYAVLLGVSSDSLESHKKFADKHSLDYPLLVDKNKEIIDVYGADGLMFSKRVTFLISPEGMIEKVYNNVDPETHAAEILFDLRNLQGK